MVFRKIRVLQSPHPLLMVLILVAAVDFLYRVVVWREPERQYRLRRSVPVLSAEEASDVVLNRVQSWVPFDPSGSTSARISPNDWSLKAVSLNGSDVKAVIALQSGRSEGLKYFRVKVGDVIEGWTVAEIRKNSIVLENEGVVHQGYLFVRAKPSVGGG